MSAQGDVANGGTILLIHAAGGAARNWGSVVRRIPEARAIDLPGHGRAGGEALRSLEEAARFVLAQVEGPLLLAGHSMGGAVSLLAATIAPERVRGLVLVATGARLQMSRAVAKKAREDWEGFLAALGATNSPLMTLQALRDAGQETVARDLEACTAWEGLPLAPLVRCPVTLVAGEKDRTAPPSLLRELGAALADAQVLELAGAGHVLPVERPDEVAQAILALAERVRVRSPAPIG